MKTRCIELSRFESEILREYIPVAAERPLPATLCRSIYRRLEGLPVFESKRYFRPCTYSHIVSSCSSHQSG